MKILKTLPKLFAGLVLIFFQSGLFAQQKGLTELVAELRSATGDSVKSDLNNRIARYYVAQSQFDSANYYSEIALALAQKIKNTRLEYNVYSTMAHSNIYSSNYPKGIEYQLKALRIAEQRKDTLAISKCYNNLGLAYSYIRDFRSSLNYYRKALSINLNSRDSLYLSKAYSNLGGLFLEQRTLDSALHYFKLSLAITLKIKDREESGAIYGNLAAVYGDKGEHERSIEFYLMAVKIQEETGDYRGLTYTYGGLGVEYILKKEFGQAELFLNKCYDLSVKNKAFDQISRSAGYLAGLYDKTGNYKKAFEFKSKELMYNDSMLSESNSEQIHKLQANYEFEKKQREIELGKSRVKAQEAELKLQNTTRYVLTGGIVVFIFISFFMYNRFKVTRKQKDIIENQKQIVEETKKELVDSITYAKRLQQAILPSQYQMNKLLPPHFILYKPKDIVAGDFYWTTSVNDTDFYFAVCDSTGHGVPGAFMSLLNSSYLNEAVSQKGLSEPDKVFDYVRQKLIENISRDGQSDGMDGVLLHFNKKNGKITYAAAHSAPLIISHGQIKETKTDKMPVGKGEKPDPFTLYSLDAGSGDTIYLFTDGYADQFGGEKGKKYKRSRLNELLVKISSLPLDEQRNVLDKTFEDWKQIHEQVDDVTVIGLKLWS